MVANLFTTLWRISFVTALLLPILTAQSIDATSSNSIPSLYSFVIHNGHVYLGGEQVVEVVNLTDLTSIQTVTVPRFAQYSFCTFVPNIYCTSNIIDHIFPFNGSLLACGSNGGVGGCSLFQGSPDTNFTRINKFTIQLSGNVLNANLFYLQNSIFLNLENNVIYSQYYYIEKNSFTLGLYNFTDFTTTASPTDSSGISEITSTYDSLRTAQTRDYFFNSPTLGTIFRYASTNTIDFDFIHIPFTEIVLERAVAGLDYEYLTNSFHGRLARICANDLGQFTNTKTFLGTFNKITIDCRQALGVRYSSSSSYVSIALKEIFILDSQNIFGFFTSQNTAEDLIQSSAVCRFISNRTAPGQDFNIETGFNSVYYTGYQPDPTSGNTSWTCAHPTTRVFTDLYGATIINILHRVVVFNEASLAFDKHFEAIITDTTPVTTSSGSRNITLFYATTFDGYLIKMKVDTTISVVSQFKVTENTKIINPQIQEINNVKYLFAISSNQMLKVSLQLCHSYVTGVTCYRDPECVWEIATKSCIQYDLISIRDVPPNPSLIVDDTCQLTLLSSDMETLIFSLQCQVKLPDIDPLISITLVSGASVSTAASNFVRESNTSARIEITDLESLTGYRITVELDYIYGVVSELVLVAYTEFVQISTSSSALTPICPSADAFSSINVTAPVDAFAALTVCIVCNSNQFCFATETYNSVVPFTFPWANCALSASLYTPEGFVVNSSSCSSVDFNRCDSPNKGMFQHVNITFVTTPTSITIDLSPGVSPQESGITQYTFTVDGMDYVYSDSQIVINDLKPNTSVTIMYTATTECGSTFSDSEIITTDTEWSQVDNCQLTIDGSQLKFQVTIETTGLCQGDLKDCVEIVSTCPLSYVSETPDTLNYAGSFMEDTICTVDVFPFGQPTLTAYYGCSASLYIPIIFSIDSISIQDTTTNSVFFQYSISPSGKNYELSIRLLETASGTVLESFFAGLPTKADIPVAFGNLEPSTNYTIEIKIQNELETEPFKTQQLIQDDNSCSPIDDYILRQGSNGKFTVEVIRDIQCPEGTTVDYICYGTVSPLSITMDNFTLASYITPEISLKFDFAFGLFTAIATCPPLNNSNYRFIFPSSVHQSYVATSITTTMAQTTTPVTTMTPVTPVTQPLTVILASIYLFYVAVATSSLTVLTSAGGLILLFGLILYYPKMLKKQEMKTAIKIENEGGELSGMNNPIGDSL